MYHDLFPNVRWNTYKKQICKKLQFESAIMTALPQVGLTSFLRNIETIYHKVIPNDHTTIIYLEVFPNRIQPRYLDKKFTELVRYKMKFPRYLENLNTEEILYEITQRGEKLLIILNRFQNLRNHSTSIAYLNMLRGINPFHIRFFLGTNLSYLTNPESFSQAGILATTNSYILPTLNFEETAHSIKKYQKIYNWFIPTTFYEKIYSLSGGVCGLVKYISKYIHDTKCKKINEEKLLENQAIYFKLKDIYTILEENSLIENYKLSKEHQKILHELGVTKSNGILKIELLKHLLSKPKSKPENGIYKMLSVQELKVFELLSENPDHIFSLDELSEFIWGEHVTKKYSLWALYKLLNNVKKKIQKYGYILENYKGRGYSLVKKD